MTAPPASAPSASDGISQGGSADWSSSYSQYLARSASQSAHTLKLYQQVMEYVSRGKLPPTIFQDHLSGFIQRRATEYTTKLSELGARFLGGLVALGSRGTNFGAQQRAGWADPSEPEILPPRFDPTDSARWFQQLAEYGGQLNLRALKAYRTQLDRVANGDATPAEVQQRSADYLANQLPLYLQTAGQLYLDLLNGLNEIRSSYEDEYFRCILATVPQHDNESIPVLNLSGPLDGTASSSLTITNTTGERAAVSCAVTDIRRADGQGPAFQPRIVLSPETVELEPGQEGTLYLSLRLSDRDYDSDALYIGSLHISGSGELPFEVKLRITAFSTKPDAESSR